MRSIIYPKSTVHSIRTGTFVGIVSLVLGVLFLMGTGKLVMYFFDSGDTVLLYDPFPVGVNPEKKEIIENPIVYDYFVEHVRGGDTFGMHSGLVHHVLGQLALIPLYQNLASISSRILVIQPGERAGQVADNFARILKWNEAEKALFLAAMQESDEILVHGKFYPGTYTVPKEIPPTELAARILLKFNNEVHSRYGETVEQVVPFFDALIIASLLEREAYDFTDMRYIAGIIWNRLFIDMRLQLDATLQYAKGSRYDEPWWPRVVPDDKYIESPFNTYMYYGLPPAPIANASLEAILAALNPVETDCMFYFHDADSVFHCTETYEDHVALLRQYYGNGN